MIDAIESPQDLMPHTLEDRPLDAEQEGFLDISDLVALGASY